MELLNRMNKLDYNIIKLFCIRKSANLGKGFVNKIVERKFMELILKIITRFAKIIK